MGAGFVLDGSSLIGRDGSDEVGMEFGSAIEPGRDKLGTESTADMCDLLLL